MVSNMYANTECYRRFFKNNCCSCFILVWNNDFKTTLSIASMLLNENKRKMVVRTGSMNKLYEMAEVIEQMILEQLTLCLIASCVTPMISKLGIHSFPV